MRHTCSITKYFKIVIFITVFSLSFFIYTKSVYSESISWALTHVCTNCGYNEDGIPKKQCCEGNSVACIQGEISCTQDGIGFDDKYCSDCVDNYKTCYTPPAGTPEIRWCGASGPSTCANPSNLPDAVLSCDGSAGSFNEAQGFVYKLT